VDWSSVELLLGEWLGGVTQLPFSAVDNTYRIRRSNIRRSNIRRSNIRHSVAG